MCFELGAAADALLVYQTEKVVHLRHARIGCLYYLLVVLILFYIIGVQILYGNEQFDKRNVSGTPRLSIRHPTVAGCNPSNKSCKADFHSLTTLPYCNVYSGDGSGKVASEFQQKCRIADRHSLLPNGVIGASLLLPTRIDKTVETRTCGSLPSSNGSCSSWMGTVSETVTEYVADIERYSVFISHSYRRDTMSGNDNRVPGFYQECLESHGRMQRLETAVFGASACPGTVRHMPIECLDASCHFEQPGSTGRVRLAGAAAGSLRGREELLDDGVYAVPEGDVFSVAKLLELAGVASLDGNLTPDGRPLREQGTVLDIAVHYGNLWPFASTLGRRKVRYEYVVSLQPSHEAKNEIVAVTSEDGRERIVEDRHGLYFTVRVEGQFGFFSIFNLFLALAEGATLLAVATFVTDKVAVYLLEDAEDNFRAKYKEVRRRTSSMDESEVAERGDVTTSSKDPE